MKRINVTLFLVFLLVPSVAHAAGVATVINDVIEVAAYALGLLLMGLLTIAVKWIGAKFKVQVPDAWMSSVNVWLDKAIAYAEEWAKKKVSANSKVSGSEKLEHAVEFLLMMVDDKKLVQMSKEQLRKLIEARLNETRMLSGSSLMATLSETAEPVFEEAANSQIDKIETTSGTYVKLDDKVLFANGYIPKQLKLVDVPRTPEGGFAKLNVLIAITIAFCMAMTACAWWQNGGKDQARATVLDCTTKNAKSLTNEFGKLYELAVVHATGGDGNIDWGSVKDSTKNFLTGSGSCVANNVIAELLGRVASAVGPQTEGVTFSPDSLKAGLIRENSTQTIKTLHGEL